MKQAGFTLLEVMASVAILTLVSGMLFMLADSLGAAAFVQEAKMVSQDEIRMGMEQAMGELRQSANSTVVGPFPGGSVTYRIADDLDGNGSAVDIGGNLELRPARVLRRDIEDLNNDGQTVTQLVCVDGANVRVLTNGLIPNEDLNGNGALDAGEDVNANGVLDRGLWFERVGPGVRVTLQAQHRAGARGQLINSTLTETVVPRN